MLGNPHQLLAQLTRLMRVASAVVSVTVARAAIVRMAVVRFRATVGPELRAIARRGQSIGRFEITYKVALVVQPDAVTDLLYAEKTRLQEIFSPFHAQESQVSHWRHADVGFEDVTQSPN